LLPYDNITIEYYVPEGMRKDSASDYDWSTTVIRKRLVMARSVKEGIIVNAVFCAPGSPPQWLPTLLAVFVPHDWDRDTNLPIIKLKETTRNLCIANRPIIMLTDLFNKSCESFSNQELAFKGAWQDVAEEAEIVLEFLEALSCKNITTANLQKEDKALKRRIKKGKLPFYETKILVIDTKEKSASQQQTRTGTHASPRQHLRRGHIRRLPSGNYWVNSCVVGDAEKGTILKQYAIN